MKNKKKWIITGVILLIGAMTTVGVARSLEENIFEVEIVNPKMEPLATEVMVPGTLLVKDEQIIYHSPDKGHVYELLVEEGEIVEKGTALMKYKSDSLLLQKEQHVLTVEASNLRLSQIKNQENNLNIQRANLKKQKDDLEKKEAELKKEIGKEEALAMLEVEKQQIKAEERHILTQQQQFEYERKLIDLEIKQQKLQKRLLDSNEEQLTVISNIDGKVIIANDTVETAYLESSPMILHIVNTEGFIVNGNLSEYNSLVVKEGQHVKIQSDAIHDEEWEGTVSHVAYSPITSEISVQYPITVEINSENIHQLRPGLQMILQIKTDERKSMVIPLAAILQESGMNYVFVVEENLAYKREVELGIVYGDNIEVVSGLSVDEKVIKEPMLTLNEGMEVIVLD
ncbi:hypothetical protein BKP45_02945 [Anaerobacillus alkalidiazotrophicus]|uniref:Uncharacterized protein n=1 Tax=Anaerobacillus alkalidiazotrophicus TaxID=472963 RepID=A0A1S2MB11_9BACI|nr:efflux RND transporter periplasmic adaptor subunit [Anaerobacillus alkalidiazotrophicus]OIJ21693.1 hypothetical protein BKP45_02945 [Anaerobacillus alkalidiazotrophicus]